MKEYLTYTLAISALLLILIVGVGIAGLTHPRKRTLYARILLFLTLCLFLQSVIRLNEITPGVIALYTLAVLMLGTGIATFVDARRRNIDVQVMAGLWTLILLATILSALGVLR